jgi:hypothetical protein
MSKLPISGPGDEFGRQSAKRLPVSPDAPDYAPEKFFHGGNCYTYALNMPDAPAFHPGDLVPGVNSDAAEKRFFSLSRNYGKSVSDEQYHKEYIRRYEAYRVRGALRDRLIPVTGDPESLEIPRGYSLIALAFQCCSFGIHNDAETRRRDHHWYRQDAGGTWSSKMGSKGQITALDAAARIIVDPREADRGVYERFFGFFLARKRQKRSSPAR